MYMHSYNVQLKKVSIIIHSLSLTRDNRSLSASPPPIPLFSLVNMWARADIIAPRYRAPQKSHAMAYRLDSVDALIEMTICHERSFPYDPITCVITYGVYAGLCA